MPSPFVRFVVRPSPIFSPSSIAVYDGPTEWMVYAEVPAAGGDGALVAVYETEIAANGYAALMNGLADLLAQPKP